jgi:hypothetical protein
MVAGGQVQIAAQSLQVELGFLALPHTFFHRKCS